ncbi:MAG: hypothetical protein ACLFNQ_04055 [Spirochaetaceae bacterium]
MKRFIAITCFFLSMTFYPGGVHAFELDTSLRVTRDVFGLDHVPGSAVEAGWNVELDTSFQSVLSEQFALVVQGERHTITGNTLLARIHVSEDIFEFGVGSAFGILNSLTSPAVPGFTAMLRTNIGDMSFLQAELIESLGRNGFQYGLVDLRGGMGVRNALVTFFYENRQATSDADDPVERTAARYGAEIDVFKAGVPYGLEMLMAWRSESLAAGDTDSLMGLEGGAGVSIVLSERFTVGLNFDADLFLIGTDGLAGTTLTDTFHFSAGAFLRYSALEI